MDIKQLDASAAYGKAIQSIGAAGVDSTSGPDVVGKADNSLSASFANMVEDAVGGVSSSTGAAEMTAAQMLTGNADLVDIVTSASNAQMVVDTVVTVRDRVINAYNDILKMPI